MTIKVLIVDDSRFFRKRLAEMIAKDPELELAGEAENGRDGVLKAQSLKPDLITMDVEMPVMNGIEAVREIMKVCPTPVLMFSSLTAEGAQATLDALEAGAMDFMPKCFDDILRNKQESITSLVNRMRELGRSRASMYRIQAMRKNHPNEHISYTSLHKGSSTTATRSSSTAIKTSSLSSNSSFGSKTTSTLDTTKRSMAFLGAVSNRLSAQTTLTRPVGSGIVSRMNGVQADSVSTNQKSIRGTIGGSAGSTSNLVNRVKSSADNVTSEKNLSPDFTMDAGGVETKRVYNNKFSLVAIGSSTGGPLALQAVLMQLPKDLPVPVIVVQHMPASFTGPFSVRLNEMCQVLVTEAQDGDVLQPGHVYVAPGGKQMLLEQAPMGQVRLHIVPSPAGINYKPCVDISFGSAAQIYKGKVLGCILTGMGADGRKACGILHGLGATIIAQNEESCVIYGMPKAVVDAGFADYVLPIEEIGDSIVVELTKR